MLVCHEANDIFLEAAKMCRYTNNEEGSTAFFVGERPWWQAVVARGALGAVCQGRGGRGCPQDRAELLHAGRAASVCQRRRM